MPKFLEEKLKAEYGHPLDAIAWAAGLFEGEGSVAGRSVAVTQKDLWCLYKLKAHFGGTVGNLRKDGTSQWWICGQSGRDFVREIYKHLSPRRQAQLDRIFFDDVKMKERRAKHKQNCRLRVAGRSRDSKGRLTNAKVLGEQTETGIRLQ